MNKQVKHKVAGLPVTVPARTPAVLMHIHCPGNFTNGHSSEGDVDVAAKDDRKEETGPDQGNLDGGEFRKGSHVNEDPDDAGYGTSAAYGSPLLLYRLEAVLQPHLTEP